MVVVSWHLHRYWLLQQCHFQMRKLTPEYFHLWSVFLPIACRTFIVKDKKLHIFCLCWPVFPVNRVLDYSSRMLFLSCTGIPIFEVSILFLNYFFPCRDITCTPNIFDLSSPFTRESPKGFTEIFSNPLVLGSSCSSPFSSLHSLQQYWWQLLNC